MALRAPMEEKPILLIYTVPQQGRPTYRRGILDALCYPHDHIIEYSYRRQHIAAKLLKDLSQLQEREGVIILVDVNPSGEVKYYPLRRVKVQRVSDSRGKATPPSNRERVNLGLSLADYVQYTAGHEWHGLIQKLDPTRLIADGKPTYFVIEGTDGFNASPHSVRAAWQDTVEAASETALLRGAVFLRLDHLRQIQPSETEVPRRNDGRYGLVYSLRPAQMYRLDFSVFEKVASPEQVRKETKITIDSGSSELFEITQPFQSIVSGLAEKSSLIACKRTIEDRHTTLSLKVEEPSSAIVNAPNPVLFVRISVSRWILLAFGLCIIFGSLLVSVDKDVVGDFTPAASSLAVWLLKIVGAILLSLAGLLGFRKLPSA